MKKRTLGLLTVAALLISLLAACGNPKTVGAQPGTPEITAEEAENIALNHAGLTREQVSRLHTEKDYDDGIGYYEVQFREGQLEYEYEIKAEGGKILSFDKDYD